MSLILTVLVPQSAPAQRLVGTWSGAWNGRPADFSSFRCVLHESTTSKVAVCTWKEDLSAFGVGPVPVTCAGTYSYDPARTPALEIKVSGSARGIDNRSVMVALTVRGSVLPGTPLTPTTTTGTYTITISSYSPGGLPGTPTQLEGSCQASLAERNWTIYVNATGANGDGSSWSSPYRSLQKALARAESLLSSGTTGIEIHVAGRTIEYKPDDVTGTSSGDRLLAFPLKNGVVLMGGYGGSGAANPEARDLNAYRTVLSGNIGASGRSDDNSYHVVNGSGCDITAILDGFEIADGNATCSGAACVDPSCPEPGCRDRKQGGGMYNKAGSPTVVDCTFVDNSALEMGGGLYTYGGNPSLVNCVFCYGTAATGAGLANENGNPNLIGCIFSVNQARRGGGMYNSLANPSVSYCVFEENRALEYGGGMENYKDCSPWVHHTEFKRNAAGLGGGGVCNEYLGAPLFTKCTFTHNVASSDGGGMYNVESSSPTVQDGEFSFNAANRGAGMSTDKSSKPFLIDCYFTENTADLNGGGMYNGGSSAPSASRCRFLKNTAVAGGGMYNDSAACPVLTDCRFQENEALMYGGGMDSEGSSPQVTACRFLKNKALRGGGMGVEGNSKPFVVNCIFVSNIASNAGGGIHATGDAANQLELLNCTFTKNSAPQSGGVDLRSGATAKVTNCVLWDDSPKEIDGPGTATVTYSDIQNGWPGIGNINSNPGFTDEEGCPGAGAPCNDVGTNAAVPPPPTTDIRGFPRRAEDPAAPNGPGTPPIVDMGAYEFQG